MDKNNRPFLGSSASQSKTELLQWTSDIVSAYLNKNEIDLRQIRQVVETVYSILSTLGDVGPQHEGSLAPLLEAHLRQTAARSSLVTVEKSITPDYIVCLEDGVRLKTLKRYLFRKYRLTPEQYRSKWSLPADYPMVAPNYAAKRSALAKKMGLGQKRKKARRTKVAQKGAHLR
jgi:predicted transcriptional regulator